MKQLAAILFVAASIARAAAPAPDPATAEALRDFDSRKFGMFIHWGLYAVPAGEWKGEYVRGIGEWIMFSKKIPVTEYEQLARQFNPVKFSGAEWAGLAASAGMRYMVITSKHHDGFAMFGSKASKYNIVDATPYRKDPMKSLSAECEKRKIGFGFYYSQDQDWHEKGGRGNTWDFPEKRDAQPYLEGKVFPQIREILSGYGTLRLIWFDTPGLLSVDQVTALRAMVKKAQPSCLINSRIGHGRHDYQQTGDNAIPIQVYTKDGKWEIPATLNRTWGYKKNDEDWKDPRDLIGKLVDIVSKGGNYLLNVGPTAEGVIPAGSQKVLREVGKWLKVNGESIYGTTPSPFYFPDITWRVTVKPNTLYVHVLNWPGSKLTLDGLESKVTEAYLLDGGRKVNFQQKAGTLDVTLPPFPLDVNDTVVVLKIADREPKVQEQFRADRLPTRLDLYAWTSRLRGEEVRYDWGTRSATNFKRAERENNSLAWYPYKSLDGQYEVEITYACDNAEAGGGFRVGPDGRGPGRTAVNGVVEATGGEFVTKKVNGTITVRPDTQTVSFGLTENKSAGVKVRKITLTKVGQ
jgi:alpha-L-fucosidase